MAPLTRSQAHKAAVGAGRADVIGHDRDELVRPEHLRAAASRAAREVVAATAPPDSPPAEHVTTIAIAGFGPQRELRTGHPAGHGVARTPRRFARPGARVAVVREVVPPGP